MEYLLIALVIAAVLSPLAWLRSSPSQVRSANFRRRALALGLQVQLVPEIDAEETETRPEAVRYFLPFPESRAANLKANLGDWTLLRDSRRGWESPWSGWKWFRGQARENCYHKIQETVEHLPGVVYGLKADAAGISVYLRESGELDVVDKIARCLQSLLGK